MSKTEAASGPMALISLGALGVVFGDIGTSPLYAFRQSFGGEYPAAVTAANILGVCSLIFWALVVVVSIKYVTFLLRADNEGQGGTMALLAQVVRKERAGMPLGLSGLALIVLFGASMLYGDGAITPAISVISAVEGLDVWTRAAHPFIVPISVVVLAGLFLFQRRGTAGIAQFFGPIMLLWFAAIGVLGGLAIAHHPRIFAALDPALAVEFLARNGLRSVLIFGAIVLCVTGCEALYADLAHFGRKPITLAWYCAVFPALILNYFGQAASALDNPHAITAPFFALVPRWGIVPMVVLATAATVIASQALISGVFSLTQQAMQLGYAPRFRIVHTSRRFAGQIYMPTVNVMLGLVCIVLVITFRSSERLGGAYGLAVTITMLADTIAFAYLLRRNWRWPAWQWVPLITLFLVWEIPFVAGNALKIVSGGWVPLVMAIALFVLFTTWNRGRRKMMERLAEHTMPIRQFLEEVREPIYGSGTAVFMAPDPHGIPFVLQHDWLRRHIMFDTIVLLTITHAPRPYIDVSERMRLEEITPRLLRAKASYGFMQQPNIDDILQSLRALRPDLDLREPTYYLAAPKIGADHRSGMPAWQRSLYRWMTRNARPLTDSLGLPPNRIIEFGVDVRL